MRERADEESTGPVRSGPPAPPGPPGPPGPPHDGPEVLRVTGAVAGEGAERGGADPASGAVLVLVSSRGTTFHLPVDGTLRAALRQATLAPSAPDAVEPPLRPKDIQTRIRAGESATELAESSGAPLEQIERYAGPVLAERAHVATVARATVVRSSRERPTLEDLVRHRLASRGVALGTVEWDAWRRGENGWALQVSFRAGTRDRLAQWAYDPAGESVEPLDDEARWLSASHEAESAGAGRRLSAVRVFDVESDGGVREVPVVPAPPLLGDTGPVTGIGTGIGTGTGTGLGAGLGAGLGTGPGSITGLGAGLVPPASTGSSPVVPGTPLDAGPDDGELGRDGTGVPWTGPDHDEVAARTMDLLDALSDRRGRRQPVPDLGPGGGWDDEEDDDDLVGALLDDLPPGAHPHPGDHDGAALPPFGSPPLPPVVEPWLRSVPPPAPGRGSADDDDTGDLPASEPVRWSSGYDAHRPVDGGAPTDRDHDVEELPSDRAGGPLWGEPSRSPLLGLVPPLAAPGTSEPWTGELAVSSRDLLSVREGRIGRGEVPDGTGELGLADTGEMTAAQLRELHAAGRDAPHHREHDREPDREPDRRPHDVHVDHGHPDQGHPDQGHDHGGAEDTDAGDPARPSAARPRTSRRSSVPSWDEIVFGSPRTDSD